MHQQMEALYSNHKTMDKNTVLQLLIHWDNDQGRVMAQAGYKLSRPPKPHPWSPLLRNTAVIRNYWKLCLPEIKHGHCYRDIFRRWEQNIQQHDPGFSLPRLNEKLSIEEVRQQFNAATKHFRKTQMNSTALRIHTYEDQIRTYMDDTNPLNQKASQKKAQMLLPTIRTETCCALFSDLRSVLKSSTVSALSNLLIPNNTNKPYGATNTLYKVLTNSKPEEVLWDTVITQEEMERHLL
jgi:hypothetical protein